jgi:hypothetical protein
MSFQFAIKFNQCEEDVSKFCLYKKKKECGTKELNRCPFAMINNPICTNKNFSDCLKTYSIVENEGKIYILYNCKNCGHCLKINEKERNKILESMEDENIYYGKDLEELLKEIKVDNVKNDDVNEIIEFFEEIITGGGQD